MLIVEHRLRTRFFFPLIGLLGLALLQGCVSKVQFEDIDAMVIDGNHLRYVSRHSLQDADSTFGHTRYRTLAEQTEVYLIPLDFSKDIEVSAVAVRPLDDDYGTALYNPKAKTLVSGEHVMDSRQAEMVLSNKPSRRYMMIFSIIIFLLVSNVR